MHFDVMNLIIKISIGPCQMWQACLLAMDSVSFCVFMCITIEIVKEGVKETVPKNYNQNILNPYDLLSPVEELSCLNRNLNVSKENNRSFALQFIFVFF